MTVTIHHPAYQIILPLRPEPCKMVLKVGFNLQHSYLHILFRVQKGKCLCLSSLHIDRQDGLPLYLPLLQETQTQAFRPYRNMKHSPE